MINWICCFPPEVRQHIVVEMQGVVAKRKNQGPTIPSSNPQCSKDPLQDPTS
jgi:hypothetical protein